MITMHCKWNVILNWIFIDLHCVVVMFRISVPFAVATMLIRMGLEWKSSPLVGTEMLFGI